MNNDSYTPGDYVSLVRKGMQTDSLLVLQVNGDMVEVYLRRWMGTEHEFQGCITTLKSSIDNWFRREDGYCDIVICRAE